MKSHSPPKSRSTLSRLKRFFDMPLLTGGLVALGSLFWLVLRTGTKPSRYQYPCQQAAKNNVVLFGLPVMAYVLHRWSHSSRFRRKIVLILTLSVMCLSSGLLITNKLLSQYWSRQAASRPPAQVSAATTGSRVVWIRDPQATTWTGQIDYWNYVNQTRVNTMFDQALLALTQRSTPNAAWQVIIPNYQVGQTIGIKVNKNNASSCNDTDSQMDAIAEPVNAIIRSLVSFGVPQSDIWVHDTSRYMAARFSSKITDTNIKLFDAGCQDRTKASAITTSDGLVSFYPPSGVTLPPEERLRQIIKDADYLINVPLLRGHGCEGVSITLKNHYGTINNPKDLHQFCSGNQPDPIPNSNWNPIIDINRHPYIANKTILIVGDALFANAGTNVRAPLTFSTFGNQSPNSLILSTDPIAADSVMTDLIYWERQPTNSKLPEYVFDHFEYGQQVGLGTFEHSNPWNGPSAYQRINLVTCQNGTCSGGTLPTPTPTSPTQPTPTRTPTPSRTPTPQASPTRTPTPIPANPYDLDNDHDLDITDLFILIANFASTVYGYADFNQNGRVDIYDFNLMVKNW
jgi:hypothetical protein